MPREVSWSPDPVLSDAEAALLWRLAGGRKEGFDFRWGMRLGFGGGDLGLQNFGAELGLAPDPHYVRPDRPVKVARNVELRVVARGAGIRVIRAGGRVVPSVSRGVVGMLR